MSGLNCKQAQMDSVTTRYSMSLNGELWTLTPQEYTMVVTGSWKDDDAIIRALKAHRFEHRVLLNEY